MCLFAHTVLYFCIIKCVYNANFFLDIYLAVKCEKNNFALQIGYFLHIFFPFLCLFLFLFWIIIIICISDNSLFIYKNNIHSELNKLVHINIIYNKIYKM